MVRLPDVEPGSPSADDHYWRRGCVAHDQSKLTCWKTMIIPKEDEALRRLRGTYLCSLSLFIYWVPEQIAYEILGVAYVLVNFLTLLVMPRRVAV